MGTILACPKDGWQTCSDAWLNIKEVSGLTINGPGMIDGQGQTWWGNVGQVTINALPSSTLIY